MKLTRRDALGLLAGSVVAPALAKASTNFEATRESLRAYQVPEWFRDAKFGIWAHWGPQSAAEDGDWYARNMYIQGSPSTNTTSPPMGTPASSASRT